MNKKVLIGAGAVVALAISGFLIGNYLNPDRDSEQPAKEGEGDSESAVDLSAWTEYRNKELGFSFQYPKEWGEPDVVSSENSLGIYFQNIYSPGNDFSIVSSSRDTCPQGDDYRTTIGQGYLIKEGKYFSRWCDNEIPRSQEDEFRVLETVNAEVITWIRECAFTDCEDKFILASMNLENDNFPGIGIAMAWSPKINPDKSGPLLDNPMSFGEIREIFDLVIKTLKRI